MNALKKELIKDIVGILMDFIPGGKYALRTAQSASILLLSREEKDTVTRIADRVFDQLYYSLGLDAENPGAAKSAAYDVLETIRKANLTPQVIVDCCLDPELLFQYVMQYPAVGIESASLIRKQLHSNGVRACCDELMTSALEIRSIQSFVYRQMLLNQRRALRALESQK